MVGAYLIFSLSTTPIGNYLAGSVGDCSLGASLVSSLVRLAVSDVIGGSIGGYSLLAEYAEIAFSRVRALQGSSSPPY
jgi:hypothetical protein